MATKADIIAEIKKADKEKKLLVGENSALKGMRAGKLAKIVLASNFNPRVRADIESYSKAGGCPVQELSISNDELGVVCKRQFAISILGILK